MNEIESKNKFVLNKTTTFSECNTLYYKLAFVVTCCNFHYVCTCDEEGYLYCCGNNLREHSLCELKNCELCEMCCCCFPCCISCYSYHCRKHLDV